jgi:cytochrome oxidase Cu insertion factor (SCO1/SenC/PrrC family)
MLATVVALALAGAFAIVHRTVPSAGSTGAQAPSDRAGDPGALESLGRHGEVPFFSLTERSGRRVTRDDLRGVVWVVDFIYTECTDTCPTQSLAFARLQQEFAGAPDFRLVSISVDPEHDTPAVLREYARRYGAGERGWFLTGDRRSIYCLARDGFRLGVTDPRVTEPLECGGRAWLGPARAWASHGSSGILMHSARVVLVDRALQIRAYHLATDEASMARLRDSVRRLLGAPGVGAR